MRRRTTLVSLSFALLVAGCGGGGGGGSSKVQTLNRTPIGGGLVAESFITGAPITVSGNGATVTGLTGAFSNIVWNNPTPRNEQALIAFSSYDVLSLMDWNGGSVRPIHTAVERIRSISFSAFGDSLFFTTSGGDNRLFRIGLAGGTPTLVLTDVTYVSVSPSGTQLAFLRGGNLYRCNLNGSNITLVKDGTNFWTRVFWKAPNQAVVGHSGGTQTIDMTSGAEGGLSSRRYVASTRSFDLHWFKDASTKENSYFRRYGSSGFTSGPLPDITAHLYHGMPSPDDQFFVTAENTIADDTFGPYRIHRRNNSGTTSTTLLVQNLPRGEIDALDVQPAIRSRFITGVGASFAWTTHALIWANSGNFATGLALVRAGLPETIKMSAGQPTGVGSNVIYSVEANAISKLAYTADKALTLVEPPLTAGNNGVLFNFNGSTGEVVNAMTYTVTRSEAKPKVETVGGRVRISGSMTGVFDRFGKAVAANGASMVEIDANGKLTVVR